VVHSFFPMRFSRERPGGRKRAGGSIYGDADGFAHFFGDKCIASGVQVDAVASEDALPDVVGIVFLEVIEECLAEVDELAVGICGDFAADCGVFFEHFVAVIFAGGHFADDAGGAENDSGAGIIDFSDDLF